MGLATMVGQIGGVRAAADLRTKQFYLVKRTGPTEVNICGAGEVALGVLVNKPNTGEPADVFALGYATVISDGNAAAIAVGDPIKSDAAGKAVKSATDKDHTVGYSDQASTTDGAEMKALIVPGSLSHA